MIVVNSQRIRNKAKLDEEYAQDIEDTITEQIPFIQSKIKEEYLNTSDETIKTIINLGAQEIILGEILKDYANDEDDSTSIGISIIKINENSSVKTRSQRAKDYIKSGWEKLNPYLKTESSFYFGSSVY